jgi:hypothetical protein
MGNVVNFNINNGGINISIEDISNEQFDYKNIPELNIKVEHFGQLTNLIKIPTDSQSLKLLADFLLDKVNEYKHIENIEKYHSYGVLKAEII